MSVPGCPRDVPGGRVGAQGRTVPRPQRGTVRGTLRPPPGSGVSRRPDTSTRFLTPRPSSGCRLAARALGGRTARRDLRMTPSSPEGPLTGPGDRTALRVGGQDRVRGLPRPARRPNDSHEVYPQMLLGMGSPRPEATSSRFGRVSRANRSCSNNVKWLVICLRSYRRCG